MGWVDSVCLDVWGWTKKVNGSIGERKRERKSLKGLFWPEGDPISFIHPVIAYGAISVLFHPISPPFNRFSFFTQPHFPSTHPTFMSKGNSFHHLCVLPEQRGGRRLTQCSMSRNLFQKYILRKYIPEADSAQCPEIPEKIFWRLTLPNVQKYFRNIFRRLTRCPMSRNIPKYSKEIFRGLTKCPMSGNIPKYLEKIFRRLTRCPMSRNSRQMKPVCCLPAAPSHQNIYNLVFIYFYIKMQLLMWILNISRVQK